MMYPKETIKVGEATIVCDKPVAKVGFLYLTINGNDIGRIVFSNFEEEELIFHFNQTALTFENDDPKKLKTIKKGIRDIICKYFGATDKTCDLEEIQN